MELVWTGRFGANKLDTLRIMAFRLWQWIYRDMVIRPESC